ncbi:MAG: RNA polymerase factor sigma-54 [Akkermansia sp.]
MSFYDASVRDDVSMSETGMHQELSQRMGASASMQLGMRVLQANGIELQQIVNQIMESNPVLELESSDELLSINGEPDDANVHEGDDAQNDWDEYMPTPVSDAGMAHQEYYYDSITAPETLSSHLQNQLAQASLSDDVRVATSLLIDSLDDRGFFEEAPATIAEREGMPPLILTKALSVLHEMEPSGVGAGDLRESLLLQLSHEGETDSLAYRVIESCWAELAKHRYDEIGEVMHINREAVQDAVERIRRLNPDPGATFRVSSNPYISPDVVITKDESGGWEIELTGDCVPKLRLNDEYKEILSESAGDASLRDFLKKAFREAKDLMGALDQRQEMILKICRDLVVRQRDYFLKGPRGLKPLGMNVVAEDVGVHLSTISRAVNGKYILGPWGYKELRSFFGSGVETDKREPATDYPEGASMEAIQCIIRDLIQNEEAKNPLSDATLADLLQKKGFKIARRTLAKYRDQMKILPASLRKE